MDLLAVQGTLKNLLQQHSSKASILRYSAFLMVQLSYPYMTTRLVIVFLPKRKHLLISRLQSPSAVVLEPRRITRYPSPNPSNLSVQERWVHSVVQEGPPEKEMAAHSSILAWRIPWTEEPGGLQSRGSQRVGHARLSDRAQCGLPGAGNGNGAFFQCPSH